MNIHQIFVFFVFYLKPNLHLESLDLKCYNLFPIDLKVTYRFKVMSTFVFNRTWGYMRLSLGYFSVYLVTAFILRELYPKCKCSRHISLPLSMMVKINGLISCDAGLLRWEPGRWSSRSSCSIGAQRSRQALRTDSKREGSQRERSKSLSTLKPYFF